MISTISVRPCDARILVAITVHFNPARLEYLAETMRSLSEFPVAATSTPLPAVVLDVAFWERVIVVTVKLLTVVEPTATTIGRIVGDIDTSQGRRSGCN